MASWLMGIVTAIVFTTLIDVILAEGESKKYIKGIAALVVLAAIVAPLPALLDSNFEFNFTSPPTNSTQDTDFSRDTYLNRIYMERYKGYELSLQNKLKAEGLDGVAVRINIAYIGGQVEIVNVTADISALVITAKDENIDINRIIISTISGGLNIPEYKVILTS
ncbi:MAG: stage III sporulation protein AF [Clostridia bacterium]